MSPPIEFLPQNITIEDIANAISSFPSVNYHKLRIRVTESQALYLLSSSINIVHHSKNIVHHSKKKVKLDENIGLIYGFPVIVGTIGMVYDHDYLGKDLTVCNLQCLARAFEP